MRERWAAGRTAAAGWAVAPGWAGTNAFGGDDPLLGRPWYHEELSREAALAAGWAATAAEEVAWHALHIDFVCFDPTWRYRALPSPVRPGAWSARLRAVPVVRPALLTLHFLDLFEAADVEAAWRRITGGTLAGLAWSAALKDVAAARLLVGLSLHALQDFYAHSTWVDDPDRRSLTWFDAPSRLRGAADVWSSGHFCRPPAGRSPHGEIRRRRARGHEDDARPATLLGSRRLGGHVALDPAGITLDAPWMVRQTAVARGFAAQDGAGLFAAALDLAARTSIRWLDLLGSALERAGHGAFWDDVRTAPTGPPVRRRAVEDAAAYGPFPAARDAVAGGPEPDGEGWAGLARLQGRGGGGRVVRLGPWERLPPGVVLHGGRAEAVERAQVLLWRHRGTGPEPATEADHFAVQVEAGVVHDSRPRQRGRRLALELEPGAVRTLGTPAPS